MRIFFILCFFYSFLFAKEEVFSRIHSHLFLKDYHSAFLEAKEGLKNDTSYEMKKLFIKTLCLNGKEKEALCFLKKENIGYDRDILEDISWCVLKKGLDSSLYSIKLSSLIGIYFTRSSRSALLIKKMINDKNAILRSIAVQLSCDLGDDFLKEEIFNRFKKENVWFVKLALLQAIGDLEIKKCDNDLKKNIKDSTYEEKRIAICSLAKIYENLNVLEVKKLLKSSFSGFRSLGCVLALKFKIKEVKNEIINLLNDPIFEVRMKAFNALAFFYKDLIKKDDIKNVLEKLYKDPNTYIAITASWAGLSFDEKSKIYLKNWALNEDPDISRFTSGVIAQGIALCKDVANEIIKKSKDPFVRANIALALIKQRENTKKCSDIIFNFIQNKTKMWMWDTSINEIFPRIVPSRIRHIDQYPDYPKAIDQTTELDLLSVLAMLQDKRAKNSIKNFLKEKMWGISGLAAITILKEGDGESIKLLRSFLQEENENIRIQAALALATFGKDETVLPILEKAYLNADRNLKLLILEAIGKVGNENSFPFLVNILNEPFLFLKIAAASSIIQIINF